MTSFWIKLLWLWFYIDSWRKAIRFVILRWRSKKAPEVSLPLQVIILKVLRLVALRMHKLVLNTWTLVASCLRLSATVIVSLWMRGIAAVRWIIRLFVDQSLALKTVIVSFSLEVKDVTSWAARRFFDRCHAVVNRLRHKIAHIREIHHALLKKTNQSLYERLIEAPDKRPILAYMTRKLDRGALSPDEICGLLNIALESGERNIALRCVDVLPLEQPRHIDYQRSAAVQLFLKGEYETAEAIWSRVEEYRIIEIEKRDLNRYGIRFLAPHWFIAIGHIAHLDTFLKFQILKQERSFTYVVDIPASIEVHNNYFLDLWRPLLAPQGNAAIEVPGLLFDEIILLQEDFWSLRVEPGKAFMFNKAGAFVQTTWEEQNRMPILSLPESDRFRGWTILESMGIPAGSWFVCLHVRESGFHQAWHDKNPGTRNADITTYRQAIDAIVARGGYVVRVGDASMRPMSGIPGLVDYALNEAKSDFMDIFLCAECRFFIGTNSGLGLIPPVFGKPCVMTNWSPIAIPQWYPNDLFIPKLVRSSADGRLLTFKELFSTPAGWSQFEKYFKERGLEVIDNTSDEISDVVVEMMDRIDGSATYTEDDELHLELMEQMAKEYTGYIGSRLGKEYLKKYHELV